jgi:hypothetical protein
MKTLLVVSSKAIDRHAGETYDDYIEVENQPSTENIDEWSNRIGSRIRNLWDKDCKDALEADGDYEKCVSVFLDGAVPYNVVLQNFRIFMKEGEGIDVRLPYLDDEKDKVVLTKELKEKLGEDYDSPSVKKEKE